MAHALSEPESLERLISVDMSPARGAISAEFAQYIDGMREVQAAGVSSKKEADVILQKYEEVGWTFANTSMQHAFRIRTDAICCRTLRPHTRAEPAHSPVPPNEPGQRRRGRADADTTAA